MNAPLKTLAIAAALAAATLSARAAAVVYTTGVQFAGGPNGANVMAWTEPNLSGFGAGIWCAIDAGNVLRPTNYTVGIGAVWFDILPGQALTPSYVSTAAPFVNAFTQDLSGRISLSVGQTFLLGFWLDANNSHTPNSGDRFGWARIQDTVSGLTLIDSAIENTGQGIYAGTSTVVPEPSSIALMLTSMLTCLCSRRRRTMALQRTAPGRLRVSRWLLPADPPRSQRATLRRPSAVSEPESFGDKHASP